MRDGGGPAWRHDAPAVQLHPSDAADGGVSDGDPVMVRSAHGALQGVARIDPALRRGVVAIPHGYAEPNVGALTSARVATDPLTGMVLQSGVAVSIAPVATDPSTGMVPQSGPAVSIAPSAGRVDGPSGGDHQPGGQGGLAPNPS
jgi:anaerobic selenocysteine-containing dehydrogenase